ncbi:uncharacterized protein LOC119721951 [Patiria miniata]|uniref:EF-hand domain-containing protein n=1 Tax=Patiria miniata TaxID=46514 RepID=A0A913ZA07_PATMI|nr:uncharacterized protein LOC119721951 [Patiria miniata]XP_038047835.1 uncharacterized protein LOC119721951 [Patiria miniata]XP_038047836.1 uncharacterized protein LOC119721951 [Patiria miniata]XP_038047837.1 uncharacterized protein LOC119721951 [Patiria miniata]XP_038047839.1 uncharacterized protein LOC119721951 [Patiria miniata]
MASKMQQLVQNYKKDSAKALEKYQVLRDLDIFVLDNSIRESTVGQLRGHTLESKWKIYNEVKQCGFKNTIVASFSHMTRVDDVFIMQLKERGEDPEGLWAFSEITEGIKNKIPDTENVPVGIRKLKPAGLYSVIFEVDLGDGVYDFNKFTIKDMCELLNKWNNWCFENLSPKAKVMYSFRDLPDTMPDHSDRAFEVVSFLANLPPNRRPFGMMFEEPRGKSMPEECGMWARYIRKVMDDHKWKGHLLVHVHEKFGYCDVTALQVLMDGADGIWASVCSEGAAMGNAPSCVTLLNLIRLGNKKVLKKFNCTYLRKAAINVTKITTGMEPHSRQPIFGARATDFVFDLNPEEFDLASFFGEEAPVRITTMASKEMIQQRLINLFGNDPQFTLELTHKMKELILEDLRTGRKEEYMSMVGLALLFDRAGGSLNQPMRDAIDQFEVRSPHAKYLLEEVRKIWDEWDLKDKVKGDNMLQFDTFYNGFLAPYFSCYRCNDTMKALQAIDMDADGMVDWNEFETYLKWALHQYPMTETVDELLDITFRKGLIPAMQDEYIKTK